MTKAKKPKQPANAVSKTKPLKHLLPPKAKNPNAKPRLHDPCPSCGGQPAYKQVAPLMHCFGCPKCPAAFVGFSPDHKTAQAAWAAHAKKKGVRSK